MNKTLIAGLKQMDNVQFRQLRLSLDTAELCRTIMRRFDKDPAFMRSELSLSATKFKHFTLGAYDYTMRDLAILQSLHYKLEIEEATLQAHDNSQKMVQVVKAN